MSVKLGQHDLLPSALSHKYGYVFVSIVVQAPSGALVRLWTTVSYLNIHLAGKIAGWKPVPQCLSEIRYRIWDPCTKRQKKLGVGSGLKL